MTPSLTVAAIIVNWNGSAHLQQCLPSLRSQTYKLLEIIVVDNHSADDSEKVARDYDAKWLPLSQNVGLAPALNLGAAEASSDLLLFVNNDMRFDNNFVASLVEPMERDPDLFVTDGMQFNWDGTEAVHLGARLTTSRARNPSAVELVPGLFFHQEQQSVVTPVFMASAACMLARRSIFEKIGAFDDRLPLGYEDVEICWRAWVRGWKTVHVPSAVCWHKVNSSAGSREGARFNFHGVLKGRLLLATKLLPLRYAFMTWIISSVALAEDLARLRWWRAADRIGILCGLGVLVPRLLAEKNDLFKSVGRTPEERLNYLLELKGA